MSHSDPVPAGGGDGGASAASVGDGLSASNACWTFGGEVSAHFDEHVARSVPFYKEGHQLVLELSDFFLKSGGLCYDLGCSTGTLLGSLAERHSARRVRFVGVDAEEEMLVRARKRCDHFANVEFVQENIETIDLQKADLIVCYYTIQFVHPKHRQEVFNKLYNALHWGGALVLFEKVRAPDSRFQDMMMQIYVEHKLAHGYTPDEVIGKSKSLKGVLEPYTTSANIDYLKRSGFVDFMTVMKYACFEGFLAIR